MATVWIPSLLRPLTGGLDRLIVPGRTAGEIIDALDRAHPGIKGRLCRDRELDPAIRILVDGRVALLGLQEPIGKESEVLFLPTISGG